MYIDAVKESQSTGQKGCFTAIVCIDLCMLQERNRFVEREYICCVLLAQFSSTAESSACRVLVAEHEEK
jgi:hypothetical protein